MRDVSEFCQIGSNNFFPGGISDRLPDYVIDSIDDFLNTLRRNVENPVNMRCLNYSKRFC